MIPKHRLSALPGEVLQTEFLDPLNISQAQFTMQLGISWTQPKLNAIINGKRQITIEIALDLSEALGTSPQFWMNLQNNYNLAVVKKGRRIARIRKSKIARRIIK